VKVGGGEGGREETFVLLQPWIDALNGTPQQMRESRSGKDKGWVAVQDGVLVRIGCWEEMIRISADGVS